MQRAGKYQLRYAAGKYWLLDMEQREGRYCNPISINESGVFILEQYFRLHSAEAAAEAVCEQYGVDPEQALADVNGFLQDLEKQGIAL